MRGAFIDLKGKRFGKLLVLEIDNDNKKREIYWKCRCDCGKFASKRGTNIRIGKTKSCGCLARLGYPEHGLGKTSFWKSWRGMKDRCLNKNRQAYRNYGGRGIKICERWLLFINFKDDMYESWLEHKKNNDYTSLDRIDNDGNYEPENCRWATHEVQQSNRRNFSKRKYKYTCEKCGHKGRS